MEKKVRTNERKKDMSPGARSALFGGRVCFKKAETDVLGRSE